MVQLINQSISNQEIKGQIRKKKPYFHQNGIVILNEDLD
jgi:hypothetical protein